MTVTHVVLLKWKAGATPDQVKPGVDALAAIPLTNTYIVSYRLGEDLMLGRTNTNHDLAIVAEFKDEADYERYATSEQHLAAVMLLKPFMESRNAVQTRFRERAPPIRDSELRPQTFFAFVAGAALALWLRRK